MKSRVGAVVIIASAAAAQASAAQSPTEQWSIIVGGGEGRSLAFDGTGGIYLAGRAYGRMYDPAAPATGWDGFLARYTSSGTLVWGKHVSSIIGNDYVNGVASDSAGNAYVTGQTYGSLGGSNIGGADLFLRKIARDGTTVWSRQTGSTGTEGSEAVATDSSGNVYIAGNIYPGGGAVPTDAYLEKYTASGTIPWSWQVGSANPEYATGVATDANGNVIMAGYTNGNLFKTLGGWGDAFVVKYSGSGTTVWEKQFGTDGAEKVYGTGTDSAGNIFVVGSTTGNMGGSSTGSNYDAFVAKLDPEGNLLWTRELETYAEDEAYGLSVGSDGSVYITGTTGANLARPVLGSSDAFAARFGPDGTRMWVYQFGTEQPERGYGILAGANGEVYLTGSRGSYPGAVYLTQLAVPEPGAVLSGAAIALAALARRRQRRA